MCTVTLLPIEQATHGFGVRIGCNRDESRLRPPALYPRTRTFGDRSATFPVDPESNGTWIAVNDAGLAMVVLNRNPQGLSTASQAAERSRGTIIPSLLHSGSIWEAIDSVSVLRMSAFNLFRLVIVSRDLYVAIDSTRPAMTYSPRPLIEPKIFTSSGLGDEVVEGPRTKLFRRMFHGFSSSSLTAAQQDRFHQHYWPSHQHLSIRMARKDARTVSYTAVQLFTEATSMIYREFDRDELIESERNPYVLKTTLDACIERR